MTTCVPIWIKRGDKWVLVDRFTGKELSYSEKTTFTSKEKPYSKKVLFSGKDKQYSETSNYSKTDDPYTLKDMYSEIAKPWSEKLICAEYLLLTDGGYLLTTTGDKIIIQDA